jgi:predicted dehydrogenase
MAAEAAKRAGAAHVFSRIEDLLERSPEFVVIANSTSQHCTALQAAIAAGSHVFVEKPISHTLDGLSIALDQASAKKLIVGVGVNLRFHPAIETVRQLAHSSTLGSLVCARAEIGHYLPEWHPG